MAEKEIKPQEASPKDTSSSKKHEGTGGSSGKSAWPEVVGLTAEAAERKIKEEAPPGTRIHVLPSGSCFTFDFRTDRVRIFTDPSGQVSMPPRMG